MAFIIHCRECNDNTPHSNYKCLVCEEKEKRQKEEDELNRFQSFTLNEKLMYLFKNIQLLHDKSNREVKFD